MAIILPPRRETIPRPAPIRTLETMRYLALATDYDGTLATRGELDARTVAALVQFKKSGRAVILVTGRDLPELRDACSRLDLFDRVVAENGALLYNPATGAERLLAESPPAEFVAALAARRVRPIAHGRVIVATWESHQSVVIEVIREMGLDLHVIFNKGAVMVLPSGVDKATGLTTALDELGLSANNVVGVGDAENDQSFLDLCQYSAAVANALPALKERVDFVSTADRGAGVAQLIGKILADDLAAL
jgi:HAD superfamily hydrolase (TIGR01484 family)